MRSLVSIAVAICRQIYNIERTIMQADLETGHLLAVIDQLRAAANTIEQEVEWRQELIPDGAICALRMSGVRELAYPAIDVTFTVLDGPFARRSFSMMMVLDSAMEAAAFSMSRLRGILESAHGIYPDDRSENACMMRRLSSYSDLDGLCFLGRVAVGRGRNILDIAITPDRKDYRRVRQVRSA
jgi:hypothetical protein